MDNFVTVGNQRNECWNFLVVFEGEIADIPRRIRKQMEFYGLKAWNLFKLEFFFPPH